MYKRASKPKATCAYIQGSGWGLLTLKISFKHITGDYLDAENSLKPLENISMRLQRKLHNDTLKVTRQHAIFSSHASSVINICKTITGRAYCCNDTEVDADKDCYS